MAHQLHLPDVFHHAAAWYWTAFVLGVAILVVYWLIVHGIPVPADMVPHGEYGA